MIIYEKTLLFAGDKVCILQYRFKRNGKCLPDAKGMAQSKAQNYLNKLEEWMSNWRLSLAPHKCAHITFSKSRNHSMDKMCLNLYQVEIPEDQSPKFLGIVFDRRLNFSNHLNSLDSKMVISRTLNLE